VSKRRKIQTVLITPEQFQKRFLDFKAEEKKKHLLVVISGLRAKSLGNKWSIEVLREFRGYDSGFELQDFALPDD